jgi:hypothetical protein
LNGNEFVTELFKELLSREPDIAEMAYYVNMLASGTPRLALVAELLQSEESIGHNVLRHTDAPEGAYLSTSDWFSSYQANNPDSGAQYTPFPSNDEPIIFDQPNVNFLFDPGLPPRQFVAVVPNGRVAGLGGSVISPDNKLLWDVCIEFNKPADPFFHSVFSKWYSSRLTYTEETVGVLTSPGSYNYYHWMFDVLPRVGLLRQSGLQIHRYIVNRLGWHPFQQETLNMCGISEEQLIECDEHIQLKARRLVVPSMGGFSGHMPKLICKLLRETLLSQGGLVQSYYRRLYISRSLAENRRIMNEQEVIGLLQAFDFQPLNLETMTVAEQISAFASAEAIVAPHGAGLANLVFCRPGTKVIELFHPTSVNPCFLALCQKVDLSHRGLVGNDLPPTNHYSYRTGDTYIDIGRLQSVLRNHSVI